MSLFLSIIIGAVAFFTIIFIIFVMTSSGSKITGNKDSNNVENANINENTNINENNDMPQNEENN